MPQNDVVQLFQEGIAAAKALDRTKAREIFTRVAELNPNNEHVWLWLAAVARSPQEMTAFLRRVLEINPSNAQAIQGLKWVESRMAQTPAAPQCPFCQAALEQPGKCSKCHALLSFTDLDALLNNGEANEQLLRAAVQRDQARISKSPDDFAAQCNLGLALLNLRQLDQGIAHLQKACDLHPQDEGLREQLTRLKQRQAAGKVKPRTRKRIVLVVDDSPTIRKLVAITLEKEGYQVVPAADGLEGLAKTEEIDPDLVLLDITMPRMDGYELCRMVKANLKTQHIPVVMLSGKDGFFDKVRGRVVGSTDYITKPFKPEKLLRIVEKYIQQNNDGREQVVSSA